MRPPTLRPLCFLRCSSSDFSGSGRVTSWKLLTDMNRRPGLVGLYFLVGIAGVLDALEEALDLLAGSQRHDRLLPVGAAADDALASARAQPLLAPDVDGVDVDD